MFCFICEAFAVLRFLNADGYEDILPWNLPTATCPNPYGTTPAGQTYGAGFGNRNIAIIKLDNCVGIVSKTCPVDLNLIIGE